MTIAMPLWTISGPKPFSKKWLGHAAMVILLSFSLILSGCSFASFTAALEEDIPVVVQMVTNVTNIVAPGVSAAIQTAGGLALASLKILCGTPAPGATQCDGTSLIGQYKAAVDSATKVNLLNQIQAALSAVNSQLNNILALVPGIVGPVGGAIATAVGLALHTVQLLLSLVPVGMTEAQKGLKAAVAQVKASGTLPKFPPRASELKKQFNAAIGLHFPTAVLR